MGSWPKDIFNLGRFFPSKDTPMIEEQLEYSIRNPEWMFVGLGNPGAEYDGTRHNVGFDFIDQVSKKFKISISERKFQAVYGIGAIQDKYVLLAKPMTYMNRSGYSVAQLASAYKIPPEKILVVADDMDLPIGKIRFRSKGSSGGHNGHKSIIASLRTEKYLRLRIGIGKQNGSSTVDHVLSKFEFQEISEIEQVFKKSIEGCELLLEVDIQKAMNKMNS